MASSQSPDEARPETATTESKEQVVAPISPDEALPETLTAESKSLDEARPETLTTESKGEATTSKSLDEARPKTLTTEPKEHEIASTPPNEDAQPEEIATIEETTPSRPHLFHGTPSQMETQYVNMLLAKDKIHMIYNALAGFFTWILLAGFILFPGTFTSLQSANLGSTGKEVLDAIKHVPLYIIGWACCGIGGLGMLWLWWRWRNNYIWLVDRIFLPGFLNSLAGVISTLTNTLGVQHRTFSASARITLIITSSVTVACGMLVVAYSFWMLRRVKIKHDRHIGTMRVGRYGEGKIEQMNVHGEQGV